MIRSVSRRIMPFVLALLILLTLPMTAMAAEFDLNGTGSIRLPCVTFTTLRTRSVAQQFCTRSAKPRLSTAILYLR